MHKNNQGAVSGTVDNKKWHQYSHMIFQQGDCKITEEAAAACYVCGVDPKDLAQKPATGDAQRDHLDEKKRQTLIVIVGNQVLELRMSQSR